MEDHAADGIAVASFAHTVYAAYFGSYCRFGGGGNECHNMLCVGSCRCVVNGAAISHPVQLTIRCIVAFAGQHWGAGSC
jgi:hypothetical protein